MARKQVTNEIRIVKTMQAIEAGKKIVCVFIKKDGSPRRMVFVGGNHAPQYALDAISGTQVKTPARMKYWTVWDMEANDWRMVNHETIKYIGFGQTRLFFN